MSKIKGLTPNPVSGIFYLRRRIPAALLASFNCGEFYKVSLETRDLRVAEKKFAIANGEYETQLATFRAALAGGVNGSLSPEEALALVERHLMARSSSGFATGGTHASFILQELDDAVHELSGLRLPTAQEMSTEEWRVHMSNIAGIDADDEFSQATLARLEAAHAIRHAPVGQAWYEYQRSVPRRRWRPLLKEPLAVLKRALDLPAGAVPGIDEPLIDALAEALLSPEVRQQLPQVASSRRRVHTNPARPDMKLAEVLELWEGKRKPRPKSLAAARKAVADFTDYIGDIGIGEITDDDCFAFRDAVASMPTSMPRSHRRLSFSNTLTLYVGRADLKRLSPASIKKYLGAIQALLSFARQERYIAKNPGAGIAIDGYSKSSNRRPFTQSELTTLFAAPIFTRPWSLTIGKSSVSNTTLRWLFLLALFTGGRIEELGQILLSDIKREGAVWYIDVDDYVWADEDAGNAKSVKTDTSVRILPLHAKLIDLGFIDYVEALRSAGGSKLFGDLKADSLEVVTKQVSQMAARLIDRVVSLDPRLVFHSFRHTFKDLRNGTLLDFTNGWESSSLGT